MLARARRSRPTRVKLTRDATMGYLALLERENESLRAASAPAASNGWPQSHITAESGERSEHFGQVRMGSDPDSDRGVNERRM